MIDFTAGSTGPCVRCGDPKGRMREVLSIRINRQRGPGFTVERLFCTGCEAEAREHEPQLIAEFQALLEAGAKPAAAAGALVSKVNAALAGEQRAA